MHVLNVNIPKVDWTDSNQLIWNQILRVSHLGVSQLEAQSQTKSFLNLLSRTSPRCVKTQKQHIKARMKLAMTFIVKHKAKINYTVTSVLFLLWLSGSWGKQLRQNTVAGDQFLWAQVTIFVSGEKQVNTVTGRYPMGWKLLFLIMIEKHRSTLHSRSNKSSTGKSRTRKDHE